MSTAATSSAMPPAPAPARRPALAVGPVNSAGQATAWARAVRRECGIDAVSFGHAPPPGRRGVGFAFPTDVTWPHPRLTPRAAKSALVRRLLSSRTHLAVDSFASLYDRLDRSDVSRELDRLSRAFPALGVALVAHGSDLRDPQQHAARLPQSYYRRAPAAWNEQVGAVAARNRATARACGLPLFVSTPDLLLEDVPATWLPVTVDAAAWICERPPFAHPGPPVFLHLPSRRVPPIKGTDLVDPVLADLEAAGRLRYLHPETVSAAAVPALVRAADVVVDQVSSGYYGVAAVEAMAAGRVVIGSLASDVAAVMPAAPPLLDVPHRGFADVVERVLADPDAAAQAAAAGPGFVATWHDGRAAARALSPWLGLPAAD